MMASSESSPVKLAGLQQIFDGAMLPDVAVASFSHTERLLPVRIVHRGAVTQALPLRPLLAGVPCSARDLRPRQAAACIDRGHRQCLELAGRVKVDAVRLA